MQIEKVRDACAENIAILLGSTRALIKYRGFPVVYDFLDCQTLMSEGLSGSKCINMILRLVAEINAFGVSASKDGLWWYAAGSNRHSKNVKRPNGSRKLSLRRANEVREETPGRTESGLAREES
jgi:hypothetical protein